MIKLNMKHFRVRYFTSNATIHSYDFCAFLNEVVLIRFMWYYCDNYGDNYLEELLAVPQEDRIFKLAC